MSSYFAILLFDLTVGQSTDCDIQRLLHWIVKKHGNGNMVCLLLNWKNSGSCEKALLYSTKNQFFARLVLLKTLVEYESVLRGEKGVLGKISTD